MRPILWIFNHYARDPGSSGGTRHHQLAVELERLGWRVLVFASSFNHFSRQQDTTLPRLWRSEVRHGVRYVWIWSPPYGGNGIRRAINILVFSVLCLLRALLGFPGGRPAVVMGSSFHLLAAEAARLVAVRHRAHFVFEVRDLWPETAVSLGLLRRGSLPERMLRCIEVRLLRASRLVVMLFPHGSDYVAERGVDARKVIYVPNGAVLAGASPRSPVRGAPSFQLCHSGSLGKANAVEWIIRAAARAQRSEPLIRLRLVGDGPLRGELERLAAREGLVGVQWVGAVSKPIADSMVAESDACILSSLDLPDLYRFGVSMNKLFDYMAAAKPVIAALSASGDPVTASACGLVCPPADVEALADCILRMAGMSADERREMGLRGWSYLAEHHSFPLLARRLSLRIMDLDGR